MNAVEARTLIRKHFKGKKGESEFKLLNAMFSKAGPGSVSRMKLDDLLDNDFGPDTDGSYMLAYLEAGLFNSGQTVALGDVLRRAIHDSV